MLNAVSEQEEDGQQAAIPATLIVELKGLLEGGDDTLNPVICPGIASPCRKPSSFMCWARWHIHN